MNPLSLSIDSSGKTHLILNLRYINMHLYKDKIKFDDWKCFKNYLLANKGYLFKFDLKNGYHHIDIFDSHQTYLGFSWDIKEATKYSVFTLTLWLILCTISFYKSSTSFSEALAFVRCKNCLFP